MDERADLGTTAYMVLGLVAEKGPCTVYDMKRTIEGSIGNFWSFPHTSLYSETGRLVDLGLLADRQEGDGRRRRLFAITPAGEQALGDWLQDPEAPWPELRYPALLKLFFMGLAPPEAIVDLAGAQVEEHAARLEELERIENELAGRSGELAPQLATLRLGIAMVGAALEFWRDVAVSPPVAPSRGPSARSRRG